MQCNITQYSAVEELEDSGRRSKKKKKNVINSARTREVNEELNKQIFALSHRTQLSGFGIQKFDFSRRRRSP